MHLELTPALAQVLHTVALIIIHKSECASRRFLSRKAFRTCVSDRFLARGMRQALLTECGIIQARSVVG